MKVQFNTGLASTNYGSTKKQATGSAEKANYLGSSANLNKSSQINFTMNPLKFLFGNKAARKTALAVIDQQKSKLDVLSDKFKMLDFVKEINFGNPATSLTELENGMKQEYIEATKIGANATADYKKNKGLFGRWLGLKVPLSKD